MFSFWRISLDRPGTLLSKEKKPSASMLGPGSERVRGTGVTTVGGVTTTGVTDGGFLCLRRRKRGAMACSMIPGDYMQNRCWVEFGKLDTIYFQVLDFWLLTPVSQTQVISKIHLVCMDYWSPQAVVTNRGERIMHKYNLHMCRIWSSIYKFYM